jgi:hypothetical protein
VSVEALVLLALFIVLPLIQQLIQATRQRNQRPPEPAGRQGPGTLARTPPPPELAVPPLPDTTPHTASDAISAGGRIPAPDGGGGVTRAPTPHRTMGRGTTAGLRTRRDLRRAIVLVAMLGPCRASHPYDWPEHAGRP